MEPRLDDPEAWASLVEAANPGSILVAIAARLGPDLRRRLTPEDVWQETLLKAWEARATFTWHGAQSFRRWLLTIAQHCIEDQRDRERAHKRSAARTVALRPAADSGTGSGARPAPGGFEPWGSTTPSRIAAEREKAAAMEKALLSLPDDLREVMRLRLFEDLQIDEIAQTLGLGESAVRHRFRKGAELYRERLRALLDPTTETSARPERRETPPPARTDGGDAGDGGTGEDPRR